MGSTPPATVYWSNFLSNIDWRKVWTLPQKFLLTNKVKEVSFKLIHRFHPVKQYLKKLKSDIDVKCSFCEQHPETCTHLFWSCQFTYGLWKDVNRLMVNKSFSDFILYFRNIIFVMILVIKMVMLFSC